MSILNTNSYIIGLEEGRKEGKKQGALEKLEKLLERLKIGEFIDKEHLWELIEDRIKELEREGVFNE